MIVVAVHSFHLVTTGPVTTARALLRQPAARGLRHAECMTVMTLGAPVVSPSRLQFRQLVVFAEWDDEQALEDFLVNDRLGRVLAGGWHIRLEFLRRWGTVEAFGDLPKSAGEHEIDEPVVAFTLARLKHPQIVRFIRWGRPVERLVRDHPGATFALAGMRPVRTVSTFSMWSSAQEMADMVRGHGTGPDPARVGARPIRSSERVEHLAERFGLTAARRRRHQNR